MKKWCKRNSIATMGILIRRFWFEAKCILGGPRPWLDSILSPVIGSSNCATIAVDLLPAIGTKILSKFTNI